MILELIYYFTLKILLKIAGQIVEQIYAKAEMSQTYLQACFSIFVLRLYMASVTYVSSSH